MSKRRNIITNCRYCGNQIDSKTKVCPRCGGIIKKPIYKRLWFITLIVVVAVVVFGNLGQNNIDNTKDSNSVIPTENSSEIQTESQNQEITYTTYEVSELMNDLDENALRASDKYKDQYVELTGSLNVIDSNGKYISIVSTGDDFAIVGVQCYIKSEEQKTAVMDMSIGDTVVVKGKIKSVGEVLGYSLDIDEINKL